ncbi:unnamed protein product [Prorocentrum cordatum]|uniref:Subtilisin n=1 Tax=Prorocentrum cordatum TaxID=2364126 RepID=A0ABN9YFJ3_9DINO|nr:unnamed protein product [Polarella glacialis]CAK0911615.1 unnamed protein product [Polarella glacialis]
MRCSPATGAIWLALGRGASALALAPEAGASPQPVSQREHSLSVLRDLVAPSAAALLPGRHAFEAQLDQDLKSLAAPVPPPELPTQPTQTQPPQPGAGEEHLVEWGDYGPADDFCAGRPIYDGPARSWDDCRDKCRTPCKFWSYEPGSVHHRCKLTIKCVDVVAGAFSGVGQDAAEEVEDQAALDRVRASSTPEPKEAVAPEANETEVQPAPEASRHACSPQGSARKFTSSAESGGWYGIGIAHHYADCANAAASMGYRNIVWNIGPRFRGRCYAFVEDVPEIAERSCEDNDCWLFGAACGEATVH